MKIFKQIIAVVLICITCISLVGCYLPKNEEIFINGQAEGNDIPLTAFSANSILPIDADVCVEYVYGHNGKYTKYGFDKVSAKICIEVLDEYASGKLNTILERAWKEIEDFGSDKYDIKNVQKEDSTFGKESIVFENEWLEGESGYLVCFLSITEKIIKEDGNVEENNPGNMVVIYYVKTKKNIILFDRYKDYKDYKKFNIFI